MKITSITASSSRKLPNINVDFASVSGFVSLTAELQPKDDADKCAAVLQAKADALVEKHMDSIGERLAKRSRDKASSAAAKEGTEKAAARLLLKHEPF